MSLLLPRPFLPPSCSCSSHVAADIKSFALLSPRSAFFNKDIRYILGTEDVCQCNVEGYDNPTDLCYPQGTSCGQTKPLAALPTA